MATIGDYLSAYLNKHNIEPTKGLGKSLFETVSTIVPIVNIDLLVYNDNSQFLLTWRDDPHCGRGWHIPGGCIRFKETCEARIEKVAFEELGLRKIAYEKEPIKVFQIINHEYRDLKNQNERGHFITLVYKCYTPSDFKIEDQKYKQGEVGYMKWFDHLPEDLLSIQSCYREIIK